MNDIRADISAACADLDAVTEALAAVRAKGTLAADSYAFFDRLRSHSTQLAEARSLIDARAAALVALTSFPSQLNPENPTTFLYNGVPVPFWQGRMLLLQSYMATCWATYDSISKVTGVLICTDKNAKSPKPTKLQEDFLSSQNALGAHVQDHLKGAYGWPIGISYAIRNWVLHDGNSHDGVELSGTARTKPRHFSSRTTHGTESSNGATPDIELKMLSRDLIPFRIFGTI